MIEQDISLKPHNTFGLSCAARYFAKADSIESVQDILSSSISQQSRLLVLGGGSNLLLTQDYDGLVLKNEIPGKKIVAKNAKSVVVEVGGGENWHEFVLWSIKNGLGGIENLSLIPGNVGASPMQNIGAYGVEIKDRFVQLSAYHIPTGEVHKFDKSDCAFGYRESVFKRQLKGEYIICAVQYELSLEHELNVSYGAIEQELEAMKVTELSIKAVSDAVINIRRSKLPDPKEIGNSGSFFKNPVVEAVTVKKLKEIYPTMPSYPAGPGKMKLAAGWLIEQAGWKGYRQGDYGVHTKQALVLVNYGNATGKQIYNLSQEILDSVKAKFGIQLEREVNIIN